MILHSQNVNLFEITAKIDKYSDKFLNLLQEIILNELKLSRSGVCKSKSQSQSQRIPLNAYCENKHIQVLRKLDISEDDSCLSDLEDEIMRTCQSGGTSHQQRERKTSEVFTIKKEPKQKQNMNINMNLNLNVINYEDKQKPIERNEYEINTTHSNHSITGNSINQFNFNQIENDHEINLESNQTREISLSITTLQQFEKFAETDQEAKIYQPLRNINYTTGFETWHESRKSSENYMDVEEDINFGVNDNISHIHSVHNTHSNNNQINPSLFNDSVYYNNYSGINTNSNTNSISINNNSHTFNNSCSKNPTPMLPPKDSLFKVPKSYKIDPMLESCSNLNFYNKPFIPKAKTREKLKNIVPFLREFKPRFLKKENIDKKILRKFRNYVKVIYKTDQEALNNKDRNFWQNFISANLLPPMKYEDERKIEFKSFNTKYLLWLFSKEGCCKFYQDFASKFGEGILQVFISAYDLINNTTEEGIIDKLKYYIHAIPEIYKKRDGLIILASSCDTTSNLSYTTKLHSEELLASYLGWETDARVAQMGSTFNLKNFGETTGYRRCGSGRDLYDRPERMYYEDHDNYESQCNFADSVMNVSFDSIPSS